MRAEIADSVHEQRASVVVVDFVSYGTTSVATEATPTVTAPSHEEEQEDNPHKTATVTPTVAVLVHCKKEIRVETVALEERSKK